MASRVCESSAQRPNRSRVIVSIYIPVLPIPALIWSDARRVIPPRRIQGVNPFTRPDRSILLDSSRGSYWIDEVDNPMSIRAHPPSDLSSGDIQPTHLSDMYHVWGRDELSLTMPGVGFTIKNSLPFHTACCGLPLILAVLLIQTVDVVDGVEETK